MELGKTPSRAPADARAAAQHNVRQRARSVSDSDSRKRKPRRLQPPAWRRAHPGRYPTADAALRTSHGATTPAARRRACRARKQTSRPPRQKTGAPAPRARAPRSVGSRGRLSACLVGTATERGRVARCVPPPRDCAVGATVYTQTTIENSSSHSLAVRSTLPTCRGSSQWEDVSAARFGRHALQRPSIGRRCGRGARAARRAGRWRPPSRS